MKQQPTPVFLPRDPKNRGTRQATVNGVARAGHHLVTKPPPKILVCVMRERGQERQNTGFHYLWKTSYLHRKSNEN